MGVATAAAIGAAATIASTAYAASQRPGAPKQPNSPNPAADYAGLTQAEINALPGKVNAELSARDTFDQQAQQQRLRLMGESAPEVAKQALSVAQQYGPAFIEQQQAAARLIDPNAMAIKDRIGSSVLEELSKGRDLTDQQRNNALADIRGAQVARGNTEGTAALLDEGLKMGNVRENLYQNRLANAGAYFSLPRVQDITAGLQTGYTPLPPDSFRLLNPNTGVAGAGIGAQDYATQSRSYDNQSQIYAQTPNPWVQGLATLGGAAISYAGYARAQRGQPGYMPTPLDAVAPARGGYNYNPNTGKPDFGDFDQRNWSIRNGWGGV